jgi:hypothetical protein
MSFRPIRSVEVLSFMFKNKTCISKCILSQTATLLFVAIACLFLGCAENREPNEYISLNPSKDKPPISLSIVDRSAEGVTMEIRNNSQADVYVNHFPELEGDNSATIVPYQLYVKTGADLSLVDNPMPHFSPGIHPIGKGKSIRFNVPIRKKGVYFVRLGYFADPSKFELYKKAHTRERVTPDELQALKELSKQIEFGPFEFE